MRPAVSRLSLVALVVGVIALVLQWRRSQGLVVQDEPAPGTAAWPPLVPLVTWREPIDGECPASHPLKAKASSGIFHEPTGLSYARTHADRCYASDADATADGFRSAKR